MIYNNNNHLGDIICKIDVGAESRTIYDYRYLHILTYFITTLILVV